MRAKSSLNLLPLRVVEASMFDSTLFSLLWSAGAFIVALGALVAFHEYGHFWVARRLGVKVLRYSIGFGKPLLSKRGKDDVEYVVAAIPLGGYVKMLDEREGDVAPEDAHRAFNRQGVWTRIAIVVAGPAANFLFAFVAYWLVFVVGTSAILPALGTVPAGSLAHDAGLRGGEVVQTLDGDAIDSWDSLRPKLIEAALTSGPVALRASDNGVERDYTLDFSEVSADPQTLFQTLGMTPRFASTEPTVSDVVAASPAEQAGMQAGDRIVAIDGQAMGSSGALIDYLRVRPGQQVQVDVLRDGQTVPLNLTVGSELEDGETVGKIGIAISGSRQVLDEDRTTIRHNMLAAIPGAIDQTWTMSVLTLRMLGRMVTGDVSVKNISGPLHIAEYAGYTARAGLVTFLSFMAIISVSLGVLNLLPVPVLDGGHLLYYLAELLKGSPVSEHTQVIGQQVGLVLLFMLMSLAFYNDISRLIG